MRLRDVGAATRTLGREGISIPEALVALLLGGFVLHLGWATIRGLDAAEERARMHGDAVLSARIVRSVLRRELAHAVTGRDWLAIDDSLSLRAFRGAGLVCPPVVSPAGPLVVAYSGDRRPEPSKDSLELVSVDGSVAHLDLVAAGDVTLPCPLAAPGEAVMEWVVSGALPKGVVAARIFERGSYHFNGTAFRYRSGAGGRQPLTPEIWDDRDTGWLLGGSSVAVRLAPREGAGRRWGAFLAWIDAP